MSKISEIVIEALTSRGFSDAEADQILHRIESGKGHEEFKPEIIQGDGLDLFYDGVLAETEKAYLVQLSPDKQTWMPKSQILGMNDTIITITRWIARQKGLT